MRAHRPTLLIALALTTAGLVAGCGDDDSGASESEGASVTAEQAVSEIGEVRAGLDDAVAAYSNGESEEAQTLAEDTYLEHFELVEGPLEEADAELNEELEETIREELVSEIESGASQRDIEELVAEIERGLSGAEKALTTGAS